MVGGLHQAHDGGGREAGIRWATKQNLFTRSRIWLVIQWCKRAAWQCSLDHFEGGWVARGIHFVRVVANMQHLLLRVLPETKVHLHGNDVRLKE